MIKAVNAFVTLIFVFIIDAGIVAQNSPEIRTDTLPAIEIAHFKLDAHVTAFEISFTVDGSYSVYQLTGNGVFGEPADRIATLPSGTRVWYENIVWVNEDGSKKMAPAEIHVVK